MAVLLCGVVLLTHESETPETLIVAIKSGAPSKRWQKAFELSNELNSSKPSVRSQSVMNEVIHILKEGDHYDAKTRGYMAVALAHFNAPEARAALRSVLGDESEDVRVYALWALANLGAAEAAADITPLLSSESAGVRKMAAYALGVVGSRAEAPALKVLLDDLVADVRWNSALALARLKDNAGEATLLKMLDRGSLDAQSVQEAEIESVMVNAARALALVRSRDAVGVLQNVSRTDRNLKVRQAALEALKVLNA